ncbi:unnamed protein product [Boreogadus saida]
MRYDAARSLRSLSRQESHTTSQPPVVSLPHRAVSTALRAPASALSEGMPRTAAASRLLPLAPPGHPDRRRPVVRPSIKATGLARVV